MAMFSCLKVRRPLFVFADVVFYCFTDLCQVTSTSQDIGELVKPFRQQPTDSKSRELTQRSGKALFIVYVDITQSVGWSMADLVH